MLICTVPNRIRAYQRAGVDTRLQLPRKGVIYAALLARSQEIAKHGSDSAATCGSRE